MPLAAAERGGHSLHPHTARLSLLLSVSACLALPPSPRVCLLHFPPTTQPLPVTVFLSSGSFSLQSSCILLSLYLKLSPHCLSFALLISISSSFFSSSAFSQDLALPDLPKKLGYSQAREPYSTSHGGPIVSAETTRCTAISVCSTSYE